MSSRRPLATRTCAARCASPHARRRPWSRHFTTSPTRRYHHDNREGAELMPRSSKSGVRGLFRGGDGRYRINLRWREAGTGEFRRYRELLPAGTTGVAAKERARRVLSAALAGGFNPKQEQERRLKAALEEYMAWRKSNGRADLEVSQGACNLFMSSLGDVELSSVSAFAVERFKRDRQAAGAGPATVNRALAVLR